MLVLGIDPGTVVCGWGVVSENGNRLAHVASGAIKTKSATPMNERLMAIYDALEEVARKHKPKAVSVEEVFVGKNVKSALAIGQARGIILLLSAKVGLPIFEYSARKVKQSVVGNGNASKEQVQFMVRNILRMPEKKEALDVSDALAIAICHLQRSRFA
ncbi:MAG: crossover junction endodeoxyribonuclease RuvC [Planctomycetes bacterium]|nr:crossover junction endodeoxyribonuclease RuvC [Planctomycetota bacterium]